MPGSPAEKLRAAIYARVSTEEQKEGQTIDSQIAELERFAREKNWELTGVYKDEGWSGSLLARPDLDRLRDDATRGRFDMVILNDVDRLARDVSHLGIVKRDLERSGVEVIFRKLPAEKSPTYNLMVNILGSFAEFEREMIADRTRRGRRHKVEGRGQFLGTLPAYGYRYILKDRATGKEGYLEIAPEEAATVRQMYGWVAEEGLSARRVVARLNERGVPARKGKSWGRSSVVRILRNEIYAGVWYYNKHYGCEPQRPTGKSRYKRALKSSSRLRPRSEWLPVALPEGLHIIERDQWTKVQEQLDKNIAFSPRNVKHFYLLRGLVKCGGCGAAFIGDPCHGKFYYRCSKGCKKLPTVREYRLDDAVWCALEEAILNPSIILDQIARHEERSDMKRRNLQSERVEIKKAWQQLEKEESRVIEAYRTGILSSAQLRQELKKINSRKIILEGRQARLRGGEGESDAQTVRKSVTEYCKQTAARIKTFTSEERQRFVRLLVNWVVFEGDKVRVKGIIPLIRSSGESVISTVKDSSRGLLETVSGFAATMIDHGARNPGQFAATGIGTDGRNPAHHISFELIKILPSKPISVLSEEGLNFVSQLAKNYPGDTLEQLCIRIERERDVTASVTHMARALRRSGYRTDRRGSRPGTWQRLRKTA